MGFLTALFKKAERSAQKPEPETGDNNKSKFRGVQLVINGDECCAAVRALNGQRFLSDEVPTLPLPDCDYDQCVCTYQLYDDRRTDSRRKAEKPFTISGSFRLRERRDEKPAGRRREDQDG